MMKNRCGGQETRLDPQARTQGPSAAGGAVTASSGLACMQVRLLLTAAFMIAATVCGFRGRGWARASVLRPLLASSVSSSVKNKVLGNHPAFKKLDEFYVNEYGLKGAMYEHVKSGAQVISVAAADNNKVFGINFRTPPSDSTGVPHVLEHSVLCGSKKFPVKEPFVDLLKGSLQNFLNAFTYPDRTCYPVASTNTKDFYNLIHVYLDAVLHPRAVSDPQVLQQEGWHYELEAAKDPLKVKGVVYNEMKGVYSSPDSLLGRAAQQALFPDNTYGVDSGGDPDRITELTFDQFRAFHQSYYHPSNSRIFFYGDDDTTERLVLIDEYLRHFDSVNVDSSIKYQRKLDQPLKKIQVPYPLTAGTEPKHMITINWLLNEKQLSPVDNLALGVLNFLLLGTSTSELRKVLIESNLGESLTGSGVSDELLQATFHVGMKGVKPENVDKVEQLALETLERLAKDGFDQEAIDAAINTLEFQLREFNTGSYPKGLSVMLAMLQHWIYDRNPVEGIAFEQPLSELKAALAKGEPVFQELLHRLLVSNNHRVTVEMIPDKELETRSANDEEARLATIKAQMTEDQIQGVIDSTKALKEAQERPDTPEARATLPRLALGDIAPQTKELPVTVVRDGLRGEDCTLLTHDLETNGVLYADVLLDHSLVAMEDLALLPLFSRMLMEAGTKRYNETALARRIGVHTGGISVSYFNELKADEGKVADPDDALLYLTIRGKAFENKVPELFDLFSEILLTARLDNQKRAVEMLRESKARKEAAILSSGHSYASTRLAARHSFLGYMGEVTGGLTSVRAAGSLLEMAENDWPSLQTRLEKIRAAIVRAQTGHTRSLVVNLTGNEALTASAVKSVDAFLKTLPNQPVCPSSTLQDAWKAQKHELMLPKRNEAFVIPSLVNYVAKSGNIYRPHEDVEGSTSVVVRHLSTGYMWDQVRVLGGAYGGFARFSDVSGRFSFLSYRDPNLLETLNIYDGAAAHLLGDNVAEEDVLQSVIGSIGDIDSPMSPDQQGYASMVQVLLGETQQSRQKWRDSILHTSPQDFVSFAQRLEAVKQNGYVAVFGSQQAIDKANTELPEDKRLVVEPALISQQPSSST